MNLYERLPLEFLADFYVEIKKNIEQELLTEAMQHELDLIEKVAENKGLSIPSLLSYSSRAKEHPIRENYATSKSYQ
ncbi:MAG TPA: hypothetical protein VEY51_14760 [Chondromyces sp.]|nr:hypothetical protein [Chondromyces sp.]